MADHGAFSFLGSIKLLFGQVREENGEVNATKR
jgi:hypothetical protein